MQYTSSLQQRVPKTPITGGVLRILLLVGGTFQSLARYLHSAAADLVLYLDCPAELDSIPVQDGVLRLALASGQTVGTLVGDDSPAALRAYFARRQEAKQFELKTIDDWLAQARSL